MRYTHVGLTSVILAQSGRPEIQHSLPDLQFSTEVGGLRPLSADRSPCPAPPGSSGQSSYRMQQAHSLSQPLSQFLGLLQDLQSSLILVFHNSHVCTLQIMGKTLTCMSDD